MYRTLRALRALPSSTSATLPLARYSTTASSFARPRSLAVALIPVESRKWISTTQPRPDSVTAGKTPSAREELKGVTRDVAEMISGRSGVTAAAAAMGAREVSASGLGGHGSIKGDFVGITQSIFRQVPQPAMLFGLAGTIPYLGTSLGTVFLAREASRASMGLNNLTGLDLPTALSSLHTLEHIQITYGAIILSFLGAIHWGMEFSKLGGEHGYRRLALGIVPVLIAWPTTFLAHGPALVAQWLGFTGTWFLDQRASTMGWTTSWYATYRFYLSIIVGLSIMATFAGTGYYGAGAGALTEPGAKHLKHKTERVSSLKRLDNVAQKNNPQKAGVRVGRREGTVHGDFQLEENDESYVKLVNVKEEQEKAKEAEEKEKEKKKNEEYQDKRDEYQQDVGPGQMKDKAKDRTGKNANMPGGEEERPDDAKQDRVKGAGPPGETTELGTSEDKDSDVSGKEVKDVGKREHREKK